MPILPTWVFALSSAPLEGVALAEVVELTEVYVDDEVYVAEGVVVGGFVGGGLVEGVPEEG